MSLVAESNSGTISEQELDKVQLYSDLCLYEEALTKLVDSVDNFKPQLEIGKQLIEADKNLPDGYTASVILPTWQSSLFSENCLTRKAALDNFSKK